MAYLEVSEILNLDTIQHPIIGLASDMEHHDSGFHAHEGYAQLLFAPSGCMTLWTNDKRILLPPSRMLYIPQGLSHKVTLRNIVAYRSMYFRINAIEQELPTDLQVMTVNPLLKQLIERICWWNWNCKLSLEQENLIKVFWDEWKNSKLERYDLILPHDKRLHKQVESFVANDKALPFLNVFAKGVGASEKTVSRIFKKETGLNYQDWRMQWKFYRAIELLIEKNSITDITIWLDFSSESAFVDFFKKHSGTTPLKYTELFNDSINNQEI
ncbi:MAG: helix-turn-helix transcriptional regulator [Flavobacteriaceae bacterium]|jgi:AraC-like DNA-binding protein|nr:helix-turn-helix transcriptional regulator [Flavobacteriaceae bacterium]